MARRINFLQTLDPEPNRTVIIERIEHYSRKAIQLVLMQHDTSTAVGSVVRDGSEDRLVDVDDLLQVAERIHQRLDGGDERARLVGDRFDLSRSQLTQFVYSPWPDPKLTSKVLRQTN